MWYTCLNVLYRFVRQKVLSCAACPEMLSLSELQNVCAEASFYQGAVRNVFVAVCTAVVNCRLIVESVAKFVQKAVVHVACLEVNVLIAV